MRRCVAQSSDPRRGGSRPAGGATRRVPAGEAARAFRRACCRLGRWSKPPKGDHMKLRWLVQAAAVVAVLGLTIAATSADEGTLKLRAKLTGFQESPPKLSPSTGSFEATVTGS